VIFKIYILLEIRSGEQGICLVAVLNFLYHLKTLLVNVVGHQKHKFYHCVISSPFWVTWHHRSRDHKTRSG